MPLSGFALKNQLKNNPSPYLAMHGSDATAWQTWGPEVFKKAKKENKLIFVSIGYFSCHWCHVMQRESYQNKTIAGILNKHFIPVKIDRELRPALDGKLISFVQATRGYSGWPLNVFITPDGHPLVGFVYLPAKDFLGFINRIELKWKKNFAAYSLSAKNAALALSEPAKSLGAKFKATLGATLMSAYAQAALKRGNNMSGGFGQKTKFPNVPKLLAVLSSLKNKKNKELDDFFKLTLEQMSSQGLFDQIRGGFYRYTVDTQWQIPHFEKMLYDNAMLADIYIQAAKHYKNPKYKIIALRTLDYMLKEMLHKSGALIASLSAVDNKNVEGGFYIWHDTLLTKIFSKSDLKIIKLAWGMNRPPPLTDGHLPVIAYTEIEVAKKLKLDLNKVRQVLRKARKRLLQEQTKRVIPKDTKLLAGWNGLALRAFSLAGKMKHPKAKLYQKTALGIKNYLLTKLWDGKDLFRARTDKGKIGNASLQDYAYVAQGLYTYASMYNQDKDYVLLKKIVNQAWSRFYTKTGWRLADNLLIAYGGNDVIVSDSALYSSAAMLARVTLQLSLKIKDNEMRDRALRSLNISLKELESDPYWFATHIRTIHDYQIGRLAK